MDDKTKFNLPKFDLFCFFYVMRHKITKVAFSCFPYDFYIYERNNKNNEIDITISSNTGCNSEQSILL